MNSPRRKELQRIIDDLTVLKADLEAVMEEEEEYRDNMPENLQGSERYEKADEACDNLSDAIDSIEDAICGIESAQE